MSLCLVVLGPILVGVPASPFIVLKGRARVTSVVKRWNGEKTKEKNKKGGLGRGCLPPYLVGAVPL
jgi:hypothetical protein